MKISCEIQVPELATFHPYMDYDFILTHKVEDNEEYRKFYRMSNNYKILDCSSFELEEPVSFERLVDAGHAVKTDEIIIPDIIGETEKSSELLKECVLKAEADENFPFKLVAVAHGKTMNSFLEYFGYLLDHPRIHRICIPFDLYFCDSYNNTSGWSQSRQAATSAINVHFPSIDKPVHLLGASNPIEVRYQVQFPWIWSIDTSSPIQQAVLGVTYDLVDGVPEKKKALVDYDYKLSDEERNRAFYNLGMLKSWANGA